MSHRAKNLFGPGTEYDDCNDNRRDFNNEIESPIYPIYYKYIYDTVSDVAESMVEVLWGVRIFLENCT